MKPTALSALGRRTTAPPISWLMQMTLDQPRLISLAAGFTDNETLPVRETRSLLDQMLRTSTSGRAALQYGTTIGNGELRRLTAGRLQAQDHLERAHSRRQSAYNPDRLLITNGSQQLLYIVTEALCDPGDIVLVEDPTYFVYLGIAQSHGLRCRGVRLDADGLAVDHLDEVLRELQQRGELARVKLFYLVSYFQNPTGRTTALARKRAALRVLRRYERAAGHPIFLLEDAAYRELRANDQPVPPSCLTLPGAAARVIYTGTYSKPFATGARIGFGLLPQPLFDIAARIKGNHDFGSASLLQGLLTQALRSGHYDEHLLRLRARYAFKARTMLDALRRQFPPAVRWHEPGGGLYVWAGLPASLRCGTQSAIFQAALARQVLYVPGHLCYADDSTRPKPDHEMRLSFGGARIADIRAGIQRLGAVLHPFCSPPSSTPNHRHK